MVAYKDESNYYSFSPTTGQVYRCLDGVETGLERIVSRLISSPRLNPSENRFKIYFCNDGSSVTISVIGTDIKTERIMNSYTKIDAAAKSLCRRQDQAGEQTKGHTVSGSI